MRYKNRDIKRQIEIASAFPDNPEVILLDIELSLKDYKVFELGIFSKSMDDKWNIFMVGECIYWSRSWTDYCLYKTPVRREGNAIKIDTLYVAMHLLVILIHGGACSHV